MKTTKRILPVILITVITIIISQLLYAQMMRREKNRCWQELEDASQAVTKELTTKFEDEITKLRLIGEIMTEDDVFGADNIDVLHLETIQPSTIFTRIDIIYPDNTVILNGHKQELIRANFEDIAAEGEYMSHRETDPVTKNQSLYYVLPIKKQDKCLAVLIGMIDAKNLPEIFAPSVYGGKANICMVDARDGNYIMDSWHDELENAYETEDRKKLKGYESVDLKNEVKNFKTGVVAFVSKTTGNPIYMYYTPVNMFNWEMLIFATDDVIFANLYYLKRIFIFAGIIEALLLILYFMWNISVVRKLEKDSAEIERQRQQLEYLSYTDVMTGVYNRHKYSEALELLKSRKSGSMGAAYIDLNGLKQINDAHSHDAGDKYIKTAAKILSDAFGGFCYRIGGDEFVIMTPDIDKEAFEKGLNEISLNAEKEGVSFSVGSVWGNQCISAMLKEAERLMYEEKQKHYNKVRRGER